MKALLLLSSRSTMARFNTQVVTVGKGFLPVLSNCSLSLNDHFNFLIAKPKFGLYVKLVLSVIIQTKRTLIS